MSGSAYFRVAGQTQNQTFEAPYPLPNSGRSFTSISAGNGVMSSQGPMWRSGI